MTGKRPFKYAINFPMEAATIIFNTGTTKFIFDDMYSNTWEIKSFLKQVVIDKKDFLEPCENTTDTNSIDSDYYVTYKGTVITSLRGISLWAIIGMFGYFLLNNKKPVSLELAIFFFGYSTIWFLLHSYLMNYFQISDTFFVVRNHIFFWTKKAYYLKNIKEVVFETQGRMPNCLRVITKDFKSKL